jgi:heme A synthase
MDFSSLLLMLHSINRWLIVLVTIIALVKFALGYFKKQEFTRTDGRIMSLWMGLLDLQLILGIILLFTLPPIRYRLEHGVIMILAVTLAHINRRWRNAEPTIKFRNYTLLILVIALLIGVGVAALPQGWLGQSS